MSADLYVSSRERPSLALVQELLEAQGYSLESGDLNESEAGSSWSWRKAERGHIVTEVRPLEPLEDVQDEYGDLYDRAAGAEWLLWLSFSSVPCRNTLIDALRVAQAAARRLDGVAYDPQAGERVDLDEHFDDFRPGLRGLWDDLQEIRRVRRELKRHEASGHEL